MEVKRCFLGIKVIGYQKIYDNILKIGSDLDVKLIPVKPNLYHFTIHFFGDIKPEDIDKIKFTFKEFKFPPFELNTNDTGIIPNNRPNKVRVLYLSSSIGNYELTQLVRQTRNLLTKNNFDLSSKQFLPHMTVARIKFGRDKGKLALRWQDLKFDLPKFMINNFILYQSNLTHLGPQYKELYSFGN